MKDDRGNPVDIMRRAGFCPWPVSGDERITRLIQRMRFSLRGGWSFVRFFITLVICVTTVFASGLLFPRWLRMMPGMPVWVPLILMAAAIGTTVRLLIGWQVRGGLHRVVGTVLEEGLCASCGYNLVGLPVEPDGCVICPECAAAWRESRMRVRAAFTHTAAMGDPWPLLARRRRRRPFRNDRPTP
jgi:hypothetical protein